MIAFRMMILATVVALLMTQAHARRSSFAPNSVFGRQDSLDEREAYPAECQGSFNVAALTAVNDMCVQCENVTRDHSTLANCRSNCFTSATFANCLELLHLPESEKETYQGHVRLLGK
ncbi:crustacean hyperglycemic hormone 6-like [Penaeus monodon]|uniref:crustacean hyperglycemic hormone 6-like n=1 Tax=Penaeus monodon TaxID=6687 RepID=UPI0018A72CD1|nr:crustacean hyperglycemic hormone 6-like [Penaeus monodon]XP_037788544.1 crustacean hyperglycemic hormone 6-like [Penaeus monodon]